MINKINIPQLRNNEFLQFFNDINNRCSRFNLSELKLDEVVENLNNTTKVLEQAYNKDNSSQVTEKLTISDGLRDNDLVGIRTICEGYSYSRNTEIAQAAKLVLHSIDRHGSSLQRLNYQAETTVIDAIVKSWEQETELTQALNKLSLNVWANELKKAKMKILVTFIKTV